MILTSSFLSNKTSRIIFQADDKKNNVDTKTSDDEKVEEEPKTAEDGE